MKKLESWTIILLRPDRVHHVNKIDGTSLHQFVHIYCTVMKIKLRRNNVSFLNIFRKYCITIYYHIEFHTSSPSVRYALKSGGGAAA